MSSSQQRSTRSGFTLVELLVVIAILAVLFSITLGAVMKFRGMGGVKATESNLKLVKNLLERQWSTVAEKAQKEAINSSVKGTIDSFAADTEGLTELRSRLLYVKARLKLAFPVSFAEVYVPNPAGLAMREYRSYLDELGFTNGNYGTFTADQQNAVCLLMALELGAGTGGVNNDQLKNASMVLGTSPSGKPVRGLVDGYENPLVLCRFPTGFTKLNPGGAVAGPPWRDPVDPRGLLSTPTWSGVGRTNSEALLHPFGSGNSYKLQPVVASAGPDKKLGLTAGTFGGANADATDNKYTTDY